MAFEVVKLVHGEEDAKKALEASELLFSQNGCSNENVPTETILANANMNILDFLSKLSIIKSKSEARRLIEQNGIIIDNKKITDVNQIIDVSQREFIVKKGKKTFVKVFINHMVD